MLFEKINGRQNFDSSGWFLVRLHHNLTDQSESISYDWIPSGQRKLYLMRYQPTFAVTTHNSDVDSEAKRRLARVQSKSRSALPYSWPCINWIVALTAHISRFGSGP